MAHHRVGPERHGDRGLELGADRQDRPGRASDERHRLGRHAPGATEDLGPSVPAGAHDGVVAPDVDAPVVSEHAVDEIGEAGARVVVRVGDRLVAEVPAGHHQGSADARQEQVVQRRVREEEAEVGQPRRDRRGHRRAGPPRRQHDRPTDGRERRDGRVAQRAQVRRRLEVWHHHGEGLVVAGLAASELRHGRLVGGVDGQVEAHRSPSPPRSRRRGARPPPRRAPRHRGDVGPPPSATRVHASCGPHCGQALGWAWNRRSSGSSYSAWHAGHIVKSAIVVAGRS